MFASEDAQGRSIKCIPQKMMAQAQPLTAQLEGTERLVDAESGAILMRHPSLRGIPDWASPSLVDKSIGVTP